MDLRAGAYSSINILSPSTLAALPSGQVRNWQTYLGYNNVALANGSQINSVTGGTGLDAYYVSDYNVTITDSSVGNKVFLNGSAADWTHATTTANGITTTTYTNTHTQQTVNLVGGASNFSINYYNSTTAALTHSALDLTV